jgi:formylglycine-generating enzyme required for sulfatase activity
MVLIGSGSFDMGSNNGENDEKPVHSVNIRIFLIGKTEVTQGQWKAVMGSNPSRFSNCGDDCPVEQVSWNDAQDYLRKLSQQTGKSYRLPSEAEWEYACRGGDSQTYCGSNDVNAVGWYDSNSSRTTNAVAGKHANAFGLYDMSGNVWEWVEDVWHGNYNDAPSDGRALNISGGDQSQRVLRGGSWFDFPDYLRSAYRSRNSPGNGYSFTGLRIARTL